MAVISKDLFTYKNLIHAASGALGSMVAMVVFYPLDTVRCRLQLDEKRKAKNTLIVLKELMKEEGFCSLYRGMVPVLQSICASNFVYFYVYHGLKNSLHGWTNSDLFMATIAGVVNIMVTSPLWLVNTRLKMAGVTDDLPYTNLIDGLYYISKTDGCKALWNGVIPSLLLVSNPAIHMAVYQYLKRRMEPNNVFSYFVLSALAKISATVSTYPIQLAQAKQRHGHPLKDIKTGIGMIEILLCILRKEGPGGLFKGMEAKLLQTVLTTALMFTCYEKIAAFVLRILK